ncbi:HNH endonuclease [Marinobacter salarius]|uniref:HNH endonuclease n=1 Tax=Marinobacter salarius TaxID=1420917 RepID=UPI003D9C06A6
MIKLPSPSYEFDQVFSTCLEGLDKKPEFRARLSTGKPEIDAQLALYAEKAPSGELYTLAPVLRENGSDPIIVSDLKKSDFLNLYEAHLRGKEKPGRVIYDELLASANGTCPYCGGIGRPRNLDHYLPKSRFPQFSLFPKNLVPACRDCNMDGKGQGFSASAGKQIIHPFYDAEHFFQEQWIFGAYDPSDEPSGSVDFYAAPPDHWSEVDKERAETHFDDFELGVRYAKEAGTRLVSLRTQLDNLADLGISPDEISRVLLRPMVENAPHVNHWESVMGKAVMEALNNG